MSFREKCYYFEFDGYIGARSDCFAKISQFEFGRKSCCKLHFEIVFLKVLKNSFWTHRNIKGFPCQNDLSKVSQPLLVSKRALSRSTRTHSDIVSWI